MTAWRETTLGALGSPVKTAFATGPFGSAIASKFFTSEGIPVIRGSNLSLDVGSRLVLDNMVFVSHDKARQHQRSTAVEGDLVFTCWGTIGQVGLVSGSSPFDRFLISNKQMKMTPDPDTVDSLYLYYLLSSSLMVRMVQSRAIGAAVPGFNLGQLRELRVALPDLGTQRRIVSMLAAFDELIAINERRIELLENLARSLYREWFVRFRFPGADRIPASGAVPEGWTRVTLGTVTSQLSRGIAPRYADDGEWTVINQRCIRSGCVSLDPARNQSRPVADAKQLRRRDILVNSTGVGTLGRVAIFLDDGKRVTADSHVTIIRAQEQVMQVWLGISLLERQDELAGMGVGSTGQTELGRDRLGALPAELPSRPVLQQFSEAVGPLLETAHSLRIYNDRLAATRDLLLPRLVAGRLDISNIDLGDLLPAEIAA